VTDRLRLRVLVPGPSEISDIKTYKYSKASDEVTSTTPSHKECRERFANAVHQVALRSFHEVFESDRRGLIQTISLYTVVELNDKRVLQDVGSYRYHHPLENAVAYRARLDGIGARIAELVKAGTAIEKSNTRGSRTYGSDVERIEGVSKPVSAAAGGGSPPSLSQRQPCRSQLRSCRRPFTDSR
jgi:hypothetical protein